MTKKSDPILCKECGSDECDLSCKIKAKRDTGDVDKASLEKSKAAKNKIISGNKIVKK